MSSERKQDPSIRGQERQSGVVSRAGVRAPSAWGAVRDSLAAVHNIAALLRSESVSRDTVLDLVPELRASGGVLRAAFNQVDRDAAPVEVADYGTRLVEGFDDLLDSLETSSVGAGSLAGTDAGLATHAAWLAEELESSADLLALLDRAACPSLAEVGLNFVVRAAGRVSGTSRGPEMITQFDSVKPDCIIATDPHVLGALLSLIAGYEESVGVGALVLRARSSAFIGFIAEAARPEDASLPKLSLRVARWVAPSESAARVAAERIGATLTLDGQRSTIAISSVTG